VRGLALTAAGEEAAVVDCLAEAPAFACPQGYVRVFTDEGAPMGALLGLLVAAQKEDQAAARGVPLGCLARLLQAFGEQPDLRPSGTAGCRAWSSSSPPASWKSWCCWGRARLSGRTACRSAGCRVDGRSVLGSPGSACRRRPGGRDVRPAV